jgi:anti-sigma regulatory factor (Ser/Thr protein kinase)
LFAGDCKEGKILSDINHNAELRISSDMIYLRPVRAFIRELTENLGFRGEKVKDIELAVDEIFSNAIEHGSVSPDSQIVIHCSATDEMIKIIVSDTGNGKNIGTQLANAWFSLIRERAKPDTERGHGLLLAYNLTDKMSVESNSMGGVDVHLVVYKEETQHVKSN